ncbi:Glutamine amidotransferase type-2 domain-containing protein [Candidatus Electronema halotolerans]
MCGFAGILKTNRLPLGPETEPVLRAMGQSIAYRGPDDEQLYQDDILGTVFRRLSIVDVEGGRQPLFNEDRSLMLMVNGEIYNHRELRAQLKEPHQFRTASDAEVILHLYEEQGADFLKQLNGMFALCLWDMRSRKLLLARDRMGIKPLFYSFNKERLLFGSEIKSLLACPDCPREFDWETALSFNLMQQSIDNPLPSFFKDIHYLPGGSLLIAKPDTGEIRQKRWWTLDIPSEEEFAADDRSAEEIIQGYGELLEDSVRLRLMADVDIGLFLSGGIDSVSVAAFASRHQSLHTFSVLGQSTFENGDASAAHQAATHLGLPNHQVLFSWHDSPFTPEGWKSLLWITETPLCDAEKLYKFHLHRYARAVCPGLKVMLLGQGSDEFNGGYGPNYLAEGYPERPEEERNWPLFMELLRDFEKTYLLSVGPKNTADYANLLNSGFLADCGGATLQPHPWQYHIRMYQASLQMFNLWHEDRTAAGNSIENRVPFLDHRLVEYTAAVPPKYYAELFWNKRILREAMRPHLPKELAERPKVPFFYGQDLRYTQRMMYELLYADDRALLREAFGDADGSHPVFDRQTVEEMINSIPDDPEYADMDHLVKLTNMGLLAQMAATAAAEPVALYEAPILPSLRAEEWDEEEIALRLALRRQEITPESIPELAEDVLLLTTGEQAGVETPLWHILINGVLEYDLAEDEVGDWIAVLRRMDGRISLGTILEDLGLKQADIRKHLEEALDYGVVVVR